MRLRTTVILLGLTLALLGYIVLHERHLDNSAAAAEKSMRVASFSPDDANVLVLKRHDTEVSFRRGRDGVWLMQQPVADRADQRLLAEFVEQAANLRIIDTIAPAELKDGESGTPVTPEELGFGSEETAVTLRKGDTELASFIIGAPTEMQDVSYVRHPGPWGDEGVQVVFSRLFETAALPVDRLRDPRLVPATADDLRQIKFAQAPASLMLKRDLLPTKPGAAPVAGPWQITQPLMTRADKQQVDEIIAGLLAVTIVEFADAGGGPLVAAGSGDLEDGRRELRLWTFGAKGKTIIQLEDSPEAEAEGYLLARVTARPGELRISRDILEVFAVNPNELRDRHLADIDFDTVLTLEIDGVAPDGSPSPPVRLARYGKDWVIERNGRKEKADAIKIRDLIRDLNNEVVEFASDSNANPSAHGFDDPLRLLTIVTNTSDPETAPPPAGDAPALQGETRAMRVGEGDSGRFFANFSDAPFVYGISAELFGKLEAHPVRWKSPELLRFSLFDLESIAIRRPPQPPLNLAYDPGTNAWTATADGHDVTDSLDINKTRAFATALSFLQGGGWTSEIARPLELIRTETILDITTRVANRTSKLVDEVRLRIAPSAPGLIRSATYYGQLNDIPDVFLIPRSTFDILNGNLMATPGPAARAKAPDSSAPPDDAPDPATGGD